MNMLVTRILISLSLSLLGIMGITEISVQFPVKLIMQLQSFEIYISNLRIVFQFQSNVINLNAIRSQTVIS